MELGFVFRRHFGRSLAIPLVLAAFIPAHATSAPRSHALPSTPTPLTWRLHKLRLTKSPGHTTSFFGYSVSLSADGHTALIGSLGILNGVYVFTWSGGHWRQTATFPIPSDAVHTASNGGADSNFGHSVALSGDGHTAMVGAPSTYHNRGAVYVFRLRGGTWHQVARLTAPEGIFYFGFSVAIDGAGTEALVGTDSTEPGGAAYLFRKPASGGWVTTSSFAARLPDPKKGGTGNFGHSVALSADGRTALVGTLSVDPAVYVYTRTGHTWSPPAKLSVHGMDRDKQFGPSVALSSDGDTALVDEVCAFTTYPCKRPGAAYVFTKAASGQWKTTSTPSAKLVAPSRAIHQEFGASVALSGDGTTALIGAPHDALGSGAGAAYVFIKPASGGWTNTITYAAAIPFPKQVKNNPFGFAGGSFGYAVALSGDGTNALISGPVLAAKGARVTR